MSLNILRLASSKSVQIVSVLVFAVFTLLPDLFKFSFCSQLKGDALFRSCRSPTYEGGGAEEIDTPPSV